MSDFDAKALASRIYRSNAKQQQGGAAAAGGRGAPLAVTRRPPTDAHGLTQTLAPASLLGATAGAAFNATSAFSSSSSASSSFATTLGASNANAPALDAASLSHAPRSLQAFLGRAANVALAQTAASAAANAANAGPSSSRHFGSTSSGAAATSGAYSSGKRPLSTLLSARSERSMRASSAAGGKQQQQSAGGARRRLLPPSAVGAIGAVTDLDRAQTQEEYEAYLRSPFSFIDKVIENPFTEEFVYLRAADGPYDLQIVSHAQARVGQEIESVIRHQH